MASPKQNAVQQAQAETSRLAKEGYGIALPGIRQEYSDLNAAMASGGEFDFQKQAYDAARGGIREGSAIAGQAQRADALRGSERAARGGNFSASIGPQESGQKLAQALYGTRLSEAQGKIQEQDQLMGMALGQSGQTGSGAMQATGQELQSIGYMQPYNSTYANVLGALNTAGSLYGAGKSAGWFGGGGAAGSASNGAGLG